MEISSMFVTCAGEWDEDTMSWKQSDVTDAAICCNNQCMGPVNFCYDYCKSNRNSASEMTKYRCSQMCEDQRKLCVDTCSLISKHVGKNNEYVICAIQNGCLNPEVSHQVDCLLEHKDVILECCRNSCTSSNEVDCDKNCKYLESVYTNPPLSLIPPDKNTRLAELHKKQNRSDNWNLILIIKFVCVCVFLFVFFIFLFLERKRN